MHLVISYTKFKFINLQSLKWGECSKKITLYSPIQYHSVNVAAMLVGIQTTRYYVIWFFFCFSKTIYLILHAFAFGLSERYSAQNTRCVPFPVSKTGGIGKFGERVSKNDFENSKTFSSYCRERPVTVQVTYAIVSNRLCTVHLVEYLYRVSDQYIIIAMSSETMRIIHFFI